MGEHNRQITCPWCRSTHGRRFLCDPAATVLVEAGRRGESGNLPTIAFDEPVQGVVDPKADTLIAQFVVKGATLPGPGGVIHPALVFTGMDATFRALPQWIYPGSDQELRRAAPLVKSMTDLAIAQANRLNGKR